MAKKIAIVVDSSGSIGDLICLYQLSNKLQQIRLDLGPNCNIKELQKLSEGFDEVYFFTDGILPKADWGVILNPKIRIIKVESW